MRTETKVMHIFKIVEEGSGKECRPAIILGEGVKIIVDCRERFDDPLPLARLIAAAPELLEACKFALTGKYTWSAVREKLEAAIVKTEGGN